MKKLIVMSAMIGFMVMGCSEDAGTSITQDSSVDETTSSAAGTNGNSSAGATGAAGCEDDLNSLPAATGSVTSTQDGNLILGKSIIPVYMPTGDWDAGYAMPTLVVGEGCAYDDDDCLLHMSYDCARFDDPDEGPGVVQYFGESFLNNNGWAENHTWGGDAPTTLTGDFRGAGVVILEAFGDTDSLTLSDEYQTITLTMDFDAYIAAAANPSNADVPKSTAYADSTLFGAAANIQVHQAIEGDADEVIWLTVKNLKFQ